MRPSILLNHTDGYCSVIGGFVVRDRRLDALYGRYVYGDFCMPSIRSTVLVQGGSLDDKPTGLQVPALSTFGQDSRGRVYVGDPRRPRRADRRYFDLTAADVPMTSPAALRASTCTKGCVVAARIVVSKPLNGTVASGTVPVAVGPLLIRHVVTSVAPFQLIETTVAAAPDRLATTAGASLGVPTHGARNAR